jgi:ABC-type branched-subunit amino acid transport system substrate-binding protein
VNDDYGRALHATFRSELVAQGIAPVYEAPFEEKDRFSNAEGLAQAIARAHADLVVWVGRSAELRILIPQLKTLLPKVRILASDGFSGPQLDLRKDSLFYGIRYVRFLDPGSAEPAARRLATYFRAHWAGEFTDQYSLSYDAVRLIAEALKHGTTRDDVRRYLEGLGHANPPYHGVSGIVQFNADGDVAPHYLLAEITPAGSIPAPLPSRR